MKKLLTMLMLLGFVGMAGNAFAISYGISYNAIGGGVLAFSNPENVSPLPLISNNTSAAGADLTPPGSGLSTSSVGTGPQDAPIAIATGSNFGAEPTPINNSFWNLSPIVPIPNVIGQTGNYSYGDAWIPTVQDVSGATNAYEIAEGNIGFGSTAEARGDNSSVTQFNYTFTLLDENIINFSFASAPYMEVYLDPLVQSFVSKAEANISLSANIVNLGTGQTVFSWSPDGLLNAITGGTELADGFSLNGNLFALVGGDHYFWNPALLSDPNAFYLYEAETNPLLSGTYQLQLKMSNNIALIAVPQTVIPEPSTVMLLGAGLIGLVAMRFRRRS